MAAVATSPGDRERLRFGAVALLPALLITLVMVAWPLVRTIILALTGRDGQFPTLENLSGVVGDDRFLTASTHSVVLTAITVTAEVTIGLLLALSLDRVRRGRRVLRSLAIVPWALPAFAAAIAWIWFLHPGYGLVNLGLELFGMKPIPWLGQPSSAQWSMVIVYIWKGLPFTTLVLLAGLQAVDRELEDAARVDGAGTYRVVRHIVLPALLGLIGLVATVRAIWVFNHFDTVYLMTGGGPLGATRILPLEVYARGIVANRPEAAAAVGLLMAVAVVALIVVLAGVRSWRGGDT